MWTTWTIARRECSSMFRIPMGWVVIALYLFLCGTVFALQVLQPGRPATLRSFFALSTWLLLPVIPAISMRLISEEVRSGTIEALMTSPVGDAAIVLGKFLGACMFLLCMLLPTGLFAVVLWKASSPPPDVGQILCGYASLIVQGVMFLAIGTLASALTANQTLAFLLTLFTILGLMLMPALMNNAESKGLRTILEFLSIDARVGDFARGLLDTRHLVFFGSGAFAFLAMAVVAVQSRRWR